MEGYDNYAIPKISKIGINIPFLKSYRFKLLMFSTILLLYGIGFSTLFGRISINLSKNMQNTISTQSNFYNGYASLSTMSISLKNCLNIYDENSLLVFENSKEEILSFIDLLKSDDLDVYSYDLANMCEKYLIAADSAIEHRANAEDVLMIEAYQESEEIKDLISMYSTYSFDEINNTINKQLVSHDNEIYHQLWTIIAILLFITIIIILISILFIRYLLSPIHSLIELIKKVSTEFWEIQSVPDTRNDETGLLVRAFYEMLNKIRYQFDQLLYKQKLEKELQEEREKSIKSEALLAKSELKVFQSQINSHFLFNTLNTISRLAFIENAPRVQRAINLVAQFLRDILTQFNRVVTITEEFANVENYIEILKLRFGNRIQFEGEIDSELEWVDIPSMTIQPLVENAVKHGFSEQKNGYIKYATEKLEDYFLIYVWDDGKGISPESKQKLIASFKNNTHESAYGGLGLLNIYYRLNLMYPNKVTPIIESEYNKFAKIGFKIKYSYS